MEADVGGTLLKIAVSEGEVPVGTTLAFIGEPGEAVEEESEEEASAAAAEPDEKAAAPLPPVAAAPPAALATPERDPGERLKASPLARRLARERGLELSSINGTGPEGGSSRKTSSGSRLPPSASRAEPAAEPAPVAAAAPAMATSDRVEELSSIRKTIARRLTEAWTIPVFQLVISADMTESSQLLARRRSSIRTCT